MGRKKKSILDNIIDWKWDEYDIILISLGLISLIVMLALSGLATFLTTVSEYIFFAIVMSLVTKKLINKAIR